MTRASRFYTHMKIVTSFTYIFIKLYSIIDSCPAFAAFLSTTARKEAYNSLLDFYNSTYLGSLFFLTN